LKGNLAIDIESVEIFSTLGKAELNRIISVSEVKTFSKRQIILEKNRPSDGLYICLSGRLQGIDYTIDGREAGLYFVTPGEFFGELALVDKKVHAEHVLATVTSTVMTVPSAICSDLLRFNANFSNQLAIALANRVRLLIRQRTLLTLPNPMQRLSAQLIELSKSSQQNLVIEFIPTHLELAMMINASRETVTRAFRTLQIEGIVKRDGDRLVLQRRVVFEQMAEGQMDVGTPKENPEQ